MGLFNWGRREKEVDEGPDLSPSEMREEVIALRKQGLTIREISDELRMAKSVVGRIVKHHAERTTQQTQGIDGFFEQMAKYQTFMDGLKSTVRKEVEAELKNKDGGPMDQFLEAVIGGMLHARQNPINPGDAGPLPNATQQPGNPLQDLEGLERPVKKRRSGPRRNQKTLDLDQIES